jgi:hypothetical protein
MTTKRTVTSAKPASIAMELLGGPRKVATMRKQAQKELAALKKELARKTAKKSTRPDAHETVQVALRGSTVRIDTEIVDLIKVMNAIPGIKTLNSCQNNDCQGYVQFAADGSKGSNTALIHFAQSMVETMTVESRKHDRMEADYVSENGPRHGTKGLRLHFEIGIGNETTMRWFPDTYPHVLRAAKKAAKQLSGAEARARVAKAAR